MPYLRDSAPLLTLSRTPWLLPTGLCCLATLPGILTGYGAYPLALGVIILFAAPILVILPGSILVQCIAWTTLVIQGCLVYFLDITAANWLPYLLCAFLLIPLIGDLLTNKSAQQLLSRTLFFPPVSCALLYLITLALSTVIQHPPLILLVAGIKTAFPIWLLTLFLVLRSDEAGLRDKLWHSFTLIYFLQLPFVLFQHFVIAAIRAEGAPWDAVVGTFGGNMFAGGANATLVNFTLWVMIYFTLRYNRQLISTALLAGTIVTGLAIIFLGEVKAVFLWLPLGMGIALRAHIFRNFWSLLKAIMFCIAFFVTLWMAYEALYWHNDTRGKDLSSRLETMTYFFDDKSIDKKTGEISRAASMTIWWGDRRSDLSERLIGFGTSASKISATGGTGKIAARYYPLDIAATTASMLLWDSGLLGLSLFSLSIGLCGIYAWRLKSHPGIPPVESARLESIAILMVLFGTMLLYNRALVDEPSTQMMLALSLGYVAYWQIRAPESRSARPR